MRERYKKQKIAMQLGFWETGYRLMWTNIYISGSDKILLVVDGFFFFVDWLWIAAAACVNMCVWKNPENTGFWNAHIASESMGKIFLTDNKSLYIICIGLSFHFHHFFFSILIDLLFFSLLSFSFSALALFGGRK